MRLELMIILKTRDMSLYTWVQFASLSDYRKGGKLHAVETYKGFRDNEAICGRWTLSPFFEPNNTKIKCKNCERKLNGK